MIGCRKLARAWRSGPGSQGGSWSDHANLDLEARGPTLMFFDNGNIEKTIGFRRLARSWKSGSESKAGQGSNFMFSIRELEGKS